ncbi:LysR family transcriptional regulator [Serratia odorifera]|uniref:LysR substrate binding domain protein n=2 Tax=Serratia odorifera TaxID=618 RepID=D4E484_SEROD|nr:LysR family transcriptional regulator [Serratia odorifera]EFE95293.1 LysR substrate binding domain protein [Serratia odorifera DSM 4582]MBJ2064702.1 LysR family transcriptional regulator [Serratia odorifera]PNK90089.1 LysR family transcriptional regulator [Serratia odorifera]RII71037.1 LysR family transcriptional regulator [Serratia odorifera]HEJ9094359.1 LysR family transcriptional regulator [Serratia odorifera]
MRSNIIEYISIFIQVVEQGSFTKAADILQLHRPAVSKAIQQLEDELGVKLIHRTTRKLSVTTKGDEFYQRAKHLLAEVDGMMANYSSTLPPRGRLKLDVPLALAHTLLIPHLAQFKSLYPDIDVVLVSSDKKTDLIAEGVDCVVRLGELQDSSFISRRLGEIRMVTCAAPAYLQRYGKPATLTELEQHQAVNFFSDHSREVMEWKFIEHGVVVSLRPASSMLVDNSDILLSCALAGLGIIQASSDALAAHIASGELEEILTQYPSVSKPVSVMYPDRRYLSPQVRVFIDWFSEIFASRTAETDGLLPNE